MDLMANRLLYQFGSDMPPRRNVSAVVVLCKFCHTLVLSLYHCCRSLVSEERAV